jgi:hypothetical protein
MKGSFLPLIAILFVVACALGAEQKMGKLRGKLQTEKGKPIAGAQVRVMSSRDHSHIKEAATDESGIYSFELEPDDYTVTFEAEGYQEGTMKDLQQVEEGKETVVKPVRLPKAKHTSLIRGSVFDAEGRGVAGAQVKLVRVPEPGEGKKFQSLSRDYVTNSQGQFAFRLPPERSSYKLTAMMRGYKPDTKVVEVHGSEAVPVALTLEQVKKAAAER